MLATLECVVQEDAAGAAGDGDELEVRVNGERRWRRTGVRSGDVLALDLCESLPATDAGVVVELYERWGRPEALVAWRAENGIEPSPGSVAD